MEPSVSTTTRRRNLVLVGCALCILAACGPAATTPAESPSIVTTATPTLTHIDIPPIAARTASIDIMDIDQQTHLLYVADRTDSGVDVFDVSKPTAKYLRTIDMGTGPNGLSIAKNVNKLFVGNNNSTVAVVDIDPRSSSVNKVIARLNTGGNKRADEMDYDPKEKKVYVANSDDGFVTVIDAVGNSIVKKIDKLGSGLEQPRYNPADGMMYLTGSDANVIFQFDPLKDELMNRFDVTVPCDPHGLAINPTTNQGLLGCSNRKKQQAVAWDFKTARVIATFDQAGAGDMVLYDAKAGRFLFAASNFSAGAAMAIFSAAPISFLTKVPTAVGSHSVAFEEITQRVYTQDQREGQAGLFSFPLPRG